MPIIKSAVKRAKQAQVRRSRNLQVKRAVKHDITQLHSAITSGKSEDIQTKLSAAYSEIDRAVKKHTLHKNTAARRKSQLAHAVAQAAGAETARAETKTTKGAGKKAAAKKTVAKKTTAAKSPAKKPAAKAAASKATRAKKSADNK